MGKLIRGGVLKNSFISVRSLFLGLSLAGGAIASADTSYTIRQTYVIYDWPENSKIIRGWFWMPDDRPGQKVLDFKVAESPSSCRITRDSSFGRSWIHVEAAADQAREIKVVLEFRMERQTLPLGSAAAAEVEKPSADLIHVALRQDEPHMAVTPEIKDLADQIAGGESSTLGQARKFFYFVIGKSEHYSKSGTSPKGRCLGDAMECLQGRGDTCTDQHALFISLCRARGISCRLIFGSRLKPANEGKDHDPGYRCWVLFFVPETGWLPVDISSADANPGSEENWFGKLDDQRIEWAEGRSPALTPPPSAGPDLLIGGWVEADGKSGPKIARTLNFVRR